MHIEGLELIGPADGLQRSPARGGDSTGVRVELRFLPRRGAFALTDGNCIIIEENAHFTDAEHHQQHLSQQPHVDATVVNHSEFMCHRTARLSLPTSARPTSPRPATCVCAPVFTSPADDVVLPDGTEVMASPNEADPPRGEWRTIGSASASVAQ